MEARLAIAPACKMRRSTLNAGDRRATRDTRHEQKLWPTGRKRSTSHRRGSPMKANLQSAEPKAIERWDASDLYGRIRERRRGAPKFTFHDGPPYANGRIHLGTAFNKILKDFIIRSRTMAGFDAPYVPGWDCHGLPIYITVD